MSETGAVSVSEGSRNGTYSDSCTVSLTGLQLFGEKRYCYPNGRLVRPAEGRVPQNAWENAVSAARKGIFPRL